MSFQSEPVINHFSHPHTLHLTNHQNQQKLPSVPISCSGCKLNATGQIYGCTTCNYFLHVKCSKMPQKITHPYHKDHVFSLISKPDYPEGFFNCDACGKQGEGFSYHCKACGIDLHILCASKPLSLTHHSHNHQLKLIFSPPYPNKIFNCDICNTTGSDHWLYRCEGCQFDVHLNCTNTNPAPAAPVKQRHTSHSQTTFCAATPTQIPIPRPQMQQPEMASRSAPQPTFGAFGPQHVATGVPVQNFVPTTTHVNHVVHGHDMPFAPTQNDLMVLHLLQRILAASSQHNQIQPQQHLHALMAGGGVGGGLGAGGFGSGVGGRVNGNGVFPGGFGSRIGVGVNGNSVFPGGLQHLFQGLSRLINNIAGGSGGGIPGLNLFGNGGGGVGLNILPDLISGGNGLNLIGGDGGLSSILGGLGGGGGIMGAFLGQ